ISIFDSVVNFSSGYEDLPDNTPTREAEKQNALALENLIVSVGLTRLGETAALKTFETQGEALSARETISSKILERLDLVDDDSFQGLKDLNATLIDAIPNPNENLATVNELQVDVDTPSLVLSYDLYDSVDKEDDIIRRNKIRNPGFVNGSLEVLSG
ncbi:MAG: hypothetical protein JRL30_29255, partial [Deltaproteobacteria bacterium]|nr:hypothetical protein [Deltaproteobacteria bacterium]